MNWNVPLCVLVFLHKTICIENDNNDDDLDDELELRMKRDGQKVTLRLKKNDNIKDNVPVYTSADNVEQKLDTRQLPVSI